MERRRKKLRVVIQGTRSYDSGGCNLVVTDNSGGCNMFITDDSGGCNLVVTDNSSGCNLVVTDNSGGCNLVVTYDILTTHWSSLFASCLSC
jgi:hypothetical protein